VHEICLEVIISVNFSGWVNELVGGQHAGAKGFMFFSVNVDLTESGIGSACFRPHILMRCFDRNFGRKH